MMGSRAVPGCLWEVAVVLLLVLQSTQSVHIKYQGFQVQLESVKKLSDLEVASLHLQTQRPLPSVCYHPGLPSDLLPICASQEADSIFKALRKTARNRPIPYL
ncbi:guanylate cyclase activator 2B isoform 2-T2 [Thomomys bottae]